ncbi:unnamed protein product, partial [marine sediment metagenome]
EKRKISMYNLNCNDGGNGTILNTSRALLRMGNLY